MASTLIPPFSKFSVEKEKWHLYSERLQFYFVATKVTDNLEKKNYFLAWCGEELFSTLTTLFSPTKLSDKAVSFDDLITKLDAHYNDELNIMAATFSLYSCKQKPGQAFSDWLEELREKARHCGFETSCVTSLRERAIRDLIVLNCADRSTRQALLKEGDPSLQRALEIAAQVEQLHKDMLQFQETTVNHDVAKIYNKPFKRARGFRSGANGCQASDEVPKGSTSGNYKCYSCGKTNHTREQCRFREYTCNVCNRKGHIQAVCKSSNVPSKPASKKVHCIPSVHAVVDNKPFSVQITVNNECVEFEVDTGSALTLINDSLWKALGSPSLKPTSVQLRSYTGQPLLVKGTCELSACLYDKSFLMHVHVIECSGPPLLGRDMILKSSLDLASFVNFCEKTVNPGSDTCAVSLINSCIAEFSELFQPELGHCTKTKAKLCLKNDAVPKFFKPRPVPFARMQAVKDELQRLEENGTISRVRHSEWATPIVPVLKANGKMRICGDFKVTLNPQILTDQFPLPTPDELFTKLNNGDKFSKIDLADAYTQIELDEASKPLTVINTPIGLFQYNRLAYGIASAPAIFQRVASELVSDIPHTAGYLDDIIITGPSDEEHVKNLTLVLQRLREYGFKLRKDKCEFLKDEVKYLGHVINKNGRQPDPERVSAIKNMPVPSNVKELECFLGKANYYGQFIKNLSTLSAPLNFLRKKGVEWNWTERCQWAMQKIKDELCNETLLVHFDPRQQLLLSTDASQYGISAIISHKDADGKEKPIAYASKTLNSAERNYSQIEKEALAIVYGVKRFKQYLLGHKFVLITDHKPLLSIFHPAKGIPVATAARLQRWALTLMAYNYSIIYKRSSEHTNADALSRLPCGPDTSFHDEDADVINALYEETWDEIPLDSQSIQQHTSKDETLRKVMEFIRNGWPAKVSATPEDLKSYFFIKNELTIEEGCVFRGLQLIIPSRLRQKCLGLLHSSHRGINRMKQAARNCIWWPKMDSEIGKLTANCEACQKNAQDKPVNLSPWPVPKNAWDRVHIDFLGPFWGEKWLIAIDAKSKYPFAVPMASDTSAPSTINALEGLFTLFGPPRTLVSDNGPPFNSNLMNKFYSKWNVSHVTSPPFFPQSNGAAERFVRTFKSSMVKLKEEGKEKNEALRIFLRDYRFAPHATTNEIPAKAILAFEPRSELQALHPLKSEGSSQEQSRRTFKTPKVWVRQYLPRKTWEAGIIEGRKGSTFVVSVRDRLMKRHVSQLRDRFFCPKPRTDHGEEILDMDLVTTGSTGTSNVLSDRQLCSPLLQPGWRSRRMTKGIPPTRFF